MNRRLIAVTALAAGAAALFANGAGAGAATTSPKPTSIDVRFLKSNEQVNMAEIAFGTTVLNRAKGPHALFLAHVTVRDHRKTQAANRALARTYGVVLPTKPNAIQRRTEAFLQGVPLPIAPGYFENQIVGHQTSIKQTQFEINHGTNPDIVGYAKYYLPIAKKHLMMSEQDFRRLQNN